MRQELPSAQEMATQVANANPNPTVIPQEQPSPQPSTPEIELANTPNAKDPTPSSFEFSDFVARYKRPATKLLAIALTLQGLFGIYKSVNFILFEYPQLEQMLVSHDITQAEVNDLAVKAVLVAISTLLSMIFALRLAIFHSTAAKRIQTAIGLLLFLSNALLHNYFLQINTSQYLVDATLFLIYGGKGLAEKIMDGLPFIDRFRSGDFEAVWYK